jgi:hypothetical protein
MKKIEKEEGEEIVNNYRKKLILFTIQIYILNNTEPYSALKSKLTDLVCF